MAARFITFEGLDGSGKSTHIKRVAGWLAEAGVDLRLTQEPGGTELGRAMRQVFLDTRWAGIDGKVEALLMFASRRQHLLEVIEPALAAGATVICDRFTDSTLAYQGYGRGLSVDTIRGLDLLATGGRVPDRTLLFDLSPELARQRGQSPKRRRRQTVDRLDSEDVDFYGKVRAGYLELAAAEPDRFHIVDSSGAHEETERQVRAALADLIAGAG